MGRDGKARKNMKQKAGHKEKDVAAKYLYTQ